MTSLYDDMHDTFRAKLRAIVDGSTADLWQALYRAGWQLWDGGDTIDTTDIEPQWAAYHRDPNGQLYLIQAYPVSEEEAGFDKEAVEYYRKKRDE